MVFPIVFIAVLLTGLLFAAVRTGTVHSVAMGSRIETLASRLAPADVFARLSRGIDGFHLDDASADMNAVLLSTKPTFATWGFFYPIIISRAPDGSSIIELGIRSKLIQWGPLVTRWHRKCRDAVEVAVNGELPSARVVG